MQRCALIMQSLSGFFVVCTENRWRQRLYMNMNIFVLVSVLLHTPGVFSNSSSTLSTSYPPVSSTANNLLVAIDEVISYVKSSQFCEQGIGFINLQNRSTSCRGRCGHVPQLGLQSPLCSCDINCDIFDDCCKDFDRHCKQIISEAARAKRSPRQRGTCTLQGYNVISGCENFSQQTYEMSPWPIFSDGSKEFFRNGTLSASARSLRDFLAASSLHIKDTQSGFVYENDQVLKQCRSPGSQFKAVPVEVTLACSSPGVTSSRMSPQPEQETEDKRNNSTATAADATAFLQMCAVSRRGALLTQERRHCNVPAFLDCFLGDTRLLKQPFHDVCGRLGADKFQAIEYSPYFTMPDLKGSPDAVRVDLDLATCYIFLPDREKSILGLEENTADYTARMVIVEHVDGSDYEKNVRFADFNSLRSRKYIVAIESPERNVHASLECPSLDVQLKQCELSTTVWSRQAYMAIDYQHAIQPGVEMDSGDNLSKYENSLSLRVLPKHPRFRPDRKMIFGLQPDGNRNEDFPKCSCMRVLAAFANLGIFAIAVDAHMSYCTLQLRLLPETPQHESMSAWSSLNWTFAEGALFHKDFMALRDTSSSGLKQHLRTTSADSTRSEFTRLTSRLRPYLETYLSQTTDVCPHDVTQGTVACLEIVTDTRADPVTDDGLDLCVHLPLGINAGCRQRDSCLASTITATLGSVIVLLSVSQHA